MIDSSSPSPSPVRLSPVCCTEPSLLRNCRNHTASTRLPPPSNSSAEASRSIDCDREPNSPRFFTASQPSPIRTRLRPPPPRLVSETCWPLLMLTVIRLPHGITGPAGRASAAVLGRQFLGGLVGVD